MPEERVVVGSGITERARVDLTGPLSQAEAEALSRVLCGKHARPPWQYAIDHARSWARQILREAHMPDDPNLVYDRETHEVIGTERDVHLREALTERAANKHKSKRRDEGPDRDTLLRLDIRAIKIHDPTLADDGTKLRPFPPEIRRDYGDIVALNTDGEWKTAPWFAAMILRQLHFLEALHAQGNIDRAISAALVLGEITEAAKTKFAWEKDALYGQERRETARKGGKAPRESKVTLEMLEEHGRLVESGLTQHSAATRLSDRYGGSPAPRTILRAAKKRQRLDPA